jgi:hypothetical protein
MVVGLSVKFNVVIVDLGERCVLRVGRLAKVAAENMIV